MFDGFLVVCCKELCCFELNMKKSINLIRIIISIIKIIDNVVNFGFEMENIYKLFFY